METINSSMCADTSSDYKKSKINNQKINYGKKNLFHITFHKRQQPQPQTLSLLTPTLLTVGRFAKK